MDRNRIITAIGNIPVQRLTAANVQGFYAAKLTAGLGPSRIQMCHLRLSQALTHGMKWGTVARNGCDAVDPPKVRAKKGRT